MASIYLINEYLKFHFVIKIANQNWFRLISLSILGNLKFFNFYTNYPGRPYVVLVVDARGRRRFFNIWKRNLIPVSCSEFKVIKYVFLQQLSKLGKNVGSVQFVS